ncbi:MAG: DNA polymerase I [Acidobacteria bacterium]|nr:DNA polymerase I [Acidobacteriota bacterium]
MADKKRIFLVDGMSNIFRSYYAIRTGLSNPRGLPTNAIFGFTMTLRKLIKDHQPDYLGVVLDSKEKTFRQDRSERYKSHRPDMPEDLVVQLPYIERVCEALRVPVIKIPKYEADDIIGTLARQATEKDLKTVIVTSDKDLSQLVHDPYVSILRMDKTGEITLDEAGVREKHGVRADQIIDWLGLMGDAVDGIPGAPGIGEKGAIQLLEQFGSIEGALAGWEQVSRKSYRESLRDNVEQIRESRDLATIDQHVPVNLDLDTLIYEEPDKKLAYELFSELDFGQLTREFAEGAKGAATGASARADKSDGAYRRLTTVDELKALADDLFGLDRFAFTLETNGNGEITGVGFSAAPGKGAQFDLAGCDDRTTAIGILKDLFENGLIEKSTYDLKNALHSLDKLAIPLENAVEDTMLQAYLLDAESSRFEPLAAAVHHIDSSIEQNTEFPVAHRADLVGRLADVLSDELAKDEIIFDFQQQTLDFVYRQIELPVAPLLFEMERTGFRVDPGVLAGLSVEMEGELEKLTRQIHKLAGREFNIASPAQLGEIFEELNFEVSRRTSTGKISTSRDVLDELAQKYELPRQIIEHRELSKLKGTYVDAFPSLINPSDGRIHTTLNQAATATGRLSSTDPNLQNIPIRTEMGRRIRSAFIPADGHVLLSADYSQIELRLLAHITKDPVMLETFRQGEDIHDRTAREVFGAKTGAELKEARRLAKIVNFGVAYVIGPFGLAQRVGISRSEAKKVIEDYYRTYAGVKKYMDELPELARENDCSVRSIFGRQRKLPQLKNKGAERARAEREAINMPMQGSASDIIKLAMIEVMRSLKRAKLKARMILQVHDELVFEVPKKEIKQTTDLVRQAMEQVAKLDIPLLVETGSGDNWMDVK